MRYTLLYIAIFIFYSVQGEKANYNDTVKISEVIINGRKADLFSPGYKIIKIDSFALQNFSQGTLADLLSENSNIFIKSYGMGGSALPSFRGTGASHTVVAWNSININNPMLGQSDLSLIPAGLIDDIQIYFGGASMGLDFGGIGGIINLESKPSWDKETVITINPGIGSFGKYTGLLKVKSSETNFQTVTKAYFHSAENDFPYLNTLLSSEPVLEIRKNSQVLHKGFIQELNLRRNKNVLSARIWYQASDRNLPSTLLVQQQNSEEKQFDESLRTMLNFDGSIGKSAFYVTGAWIYNKLNYLNRLVSIDSRNISESLILKAGFENRIGKYSKIKAVLTDESGVVKSNNYQSMEVRNNSTLTVTAERNGNSRLGMIILLREIIDRKTFLAPDFSAGLKLRLSDSQEYYLKSNISRNSKIPSLNDLFWVPGGNSGLKNEYAFMYELGFEMNKKISLPISLRYDLSIFRNSIKNMILWHPGAFSYWTADNIQIVNSSGLETSATLEYNLQNLILQIDAGYSYTKATADVSNDNGNSISGKQLVYIPQNQGSSSFRLSYKNFYSSWVTNITGKRFITSDNSKYLVGYWLNNVIAGTKLKFKGNLLDTSFNIENIFNVNYQTIAYYPLPGRMYSVKLLIQIVK